MEGLKYLLVFILGLLYQYVYSVLDLIIQDLTNKQTLKATKIQAEINQLSQELQELQPAIGFQVPNGTEEYYDK